YKGNFFKPDHIFRMIDEEPAPNFVSIADLCSLNGSDTPFTKLKGDEGEKDEEKESIRVYKERNSLQKNDAQKKLDFARAQIIASFEATLLVTRHYLFSF
ncbi:hypothetical protein PFISCL1PPCAC_23036, partial [Pristionchus fissidentatus]